MAATESRKINYPAAVQATIVPVCVTDRSPYPRRPYALLACPATKEKSHLAVAFLIQLSRTSCAIPRRYPHPYPYKLCYLRNLTHPNVAGNTYFKPDQPSTYAHANFINTAELSIAIITIKTLSLQGTIMNFPAVRFVQGFKRGISPPSQPVEKSVGLDAQRSCALATARIAERSKSSQLRRR